MSASRGRRAADSGRTLRRAVGMVRRRPGGDCGTTLIEVTVALSLMSVLMAMFMTAMLVVYRSANTSEAISTVRSQLTTAFLRLDKEIRYAAEISEPAQVSADWYLEYQQLTADGATCTQLRLRAAGGLLQQRQWTEGAAPGVFRTLASNVSSAQPFELLPGDPTAETPGASQYQQLKVSLQVSSRAGGAGTVKDLSVTFTALNATRDAGGATACRQQGRAQL